MGYFVSVHHSYFLYTHAIPARGKRIFGEDEMDAELCIKDQWNLSIAKIHLGDVESSNILCEEIARRWNEFEEWHEC